MYMYMYMYMYIYMYILIKESKNALVPKDSFANIINAEHMNIPLSWSMSLHTCT